MRTGGVIRLLIIGVNVTLIFILPWAGEPEGLLISPILPFVAMTGLIPGYYLLVRKNKDGKLKWPNWNTNPFNLKGDSALENIDFFGVLFAIIGLSMIMSSKIHYEGISKLGLSSLSLGLGILLGLLLTVKVAQRKKADS